MSKNSFFKDYLLRGNELRICTQYSSAKFVLRTYDYILSSLSIAAILGYTIYYFTKCRRTVTGNFTLCSLFTLSCGLISYCFIMTTHSHVSCRLIASASHYFLLAVHSWTNAISVWIVKGLMAVQVTRSRGWRTYCKYSASAWVAPLPFVSLAYVLNWVEWKPLYPVFADNFCFIADGWLRFAISTGPIYTLIAVNLVLCTIAMKLVIKTGTAIPRNMKEKTKRKVITVIKLQIVFGFYWILLPFTEINTPHVHVLQAVLSTFFTRQGVIVVIGQFLNVKNVKKVQNEAQKLMSRNASYLQLHSRNR